MAEQRWIVGDFTTGRYLADLPAAKGSTWSTSLNDPETVKAVLPWSSELVRALHRGGHFEPWQTFLGVAHGSTITAAGPITEPGSYDHDAHSFTVSASGAKSYLDRRFILPAVANTQPLYDPVAKRTNPLTDSARTGSYASIIRSWVQQAAGWGTVFPPINPPAVIAGDRVRNFLGVDLKFIGEAINEIVDAGDGVDVRLRPTWTTAEQTWVLWQLEVGTPFLAGGPVVWDLTRPNVNLSGFKMTVDGSKLATSAWLSGGRGNDQPLIRKSTDHTSVAAGALPLDVVDSSHSSVIDPVTLDSWASALLLQSRRPTLTCSFEAAGLPDVDAYQVGDWAVVVTDGTVPHLVEGPNQMRILGRSGSADKPSVSVTCVPVRQQDAWS